MIYCNTHIHCRFHDVPPVPQISTQPFLHNDKEKSRHTFSVYDNDKTESIVMLIKNIMRGGHSVTNHGILLA